MEQGTGQPVEKQPAPAVSGRIPTSLGCGILLFMLVFGLACIWVAGMLAFEGQVTLRAGQPNELRLWLVEDGGPAGLGFSYSVSVDVPELENLACYQTRVRFVMWSDHVEGQPARYCRCYQSLDGAWVDAGACE